MICDGWISISFVYFCVSRFAVCDRNYDWGQRKTQLWRRLLACVAGGIAVLCTRRGKFGCGAAVQVEWELAAEPPRAASSPLLFFGSQLRRQNFNHTIPPAAQARRLLNFRVRMFVKSAVISHSTISFANRIQCVISKPASIVRIHWDFSIPAVHAFLPK